MPSASLTVAHEVHQYNHELIISSLHHRCGVEQKCATCYCNFGKKKKGFQPGDKYYDGPVVDSGRTIDEIERDIEAEKERIKDMKWTPDMLDE